VSAVTRTIRTQKYRLMSISCSSKPTTSKGKDKEEEITEKLGDLSVEHKPTPAKSPRPSSTKPRVPAAFTESVPAPPGEDTPLARLEAVADLYLYDQSTGLFMTQEKGIEAKVLEAGRYLCESNARLLIARNTNEMYHFQTTRLARNHISISSMALSAPR
jgi:hypothetical protein